MVFKETKNKGILEYWTMVLNFVMYGFQGGQRKKLRMNYQDCWKKMWFSTQSLSVHVYKNMQHKKH